MERAQSWGWAGTVKEFLDEPSASVESKLEAHLIRLLGQHASGSQQRAWQEEVSLLTRSLRDLLVARPDAQGWGLALEYELHLEGGRRPDVVLHSGDSIHVLEFKQGTAVTSAAVDQVSAYARDLAEYHAGSHDVPVRPVLVLTRGAQDLRATLPSRVDVVAPAHLGALLLDEKPGHGVEQFDGWLNAKYQPLPSLVEAARMIFREEPLPRIRRAESAGIPEAVALLARLAKEAERDSDRVLAMLAGVPGAGKTLAGLQLVYERLSDADDAVFLSGNGPLVAVLRDALKNKAFVQDLHAFVTTFGMSDRAPQHHVMVFDEAQRAWDRGYMAHRDRGVDSEPDVLIQVGERLANWCALVGLVGDGQEIHSGEEGGIGQWSDAIAERGSADWKVHCPPRLASHFATLDCTQHPELDLTISLRSRKAEQLHQWVSSMLDGRFYEAAGIAATMQANDFVMYVTRDLDHAKQYLIHRYVSQEDARFGLLASSRTQSFLPRFGVRSDWVATKTVNFGHWYNRPRGESRAGGNLDEVVTEFGCQGLELDMPLVAWGDDLTWDGSRWHAKPGRPRYRQEDPRQLRLNCYRVLLTRGRDGFVLYVPDDPVMESTAAMLLAAGVRILEQEEAAVTIDA